MNSGSLFAFALLATGIVAASTAACSSEPSPAEKKSSNEAPPGAEDATGEKAPPETGADAESFDLVLRGTKMSGVWKLGETSEEIMAAIERIDTKERVAWTAKTVNAPTDTFELSWPKLLARNASYRLAVAAYGRYALYTIGPATSNVLFEVDQEKTRTTSDKNYREAYDVLNTKLSLAPGTYEAALPADDTYVKLIIGPSGVLATRMFAFGCAGTGGCGNVSVEGNAECGPSFVRGDTKEAKFGSVRNQEKISATVTVEGSGLRVKGTMQSGTCCKTSFDVVAAKKSAAVDSCK